MLLSVNVWLLSKHTVTNHCIHNRYLNTYNYVNNGYYLLTPIIYDMDITVELLKFRTHTEWTVKFGSKNSEIVHLYNILYLYIPVLDINI